jgi:hypothetical protein
MADLERKNLRVVFDPAGVNMDAVVYDPASDEFVTMCKISLKGLPRSQPSAKEYAKRTGETLAKIPALYEGVSAARIEYQARINNYNGAIQKALEEFYAKRGCDVEVVAPKDVFARVRPIMETVPKCKALLDEHERETKKKRKYTLKKKAFCAFGMQLLRPGHEIRMMKGVEEGRKMLEKEMHAFDEKHKGQLNTPRKKKRRVKKRQDDLADCVVIALDNEHIRKRLKRSSK